MLARDSQLLLPKVLYACKLLAKILFENFIMKIMRSEILVQEYFGRMAK